MSGAGNQALNLNTEVDAVKNLKQCLEACVDAWGSYVVTYVPSGVSICVPPYRKILAENFDGEKLRERITLGWILCILKEQIKIYDLHYPGEGGSILNLHTQKLKEAFAAAENVHRAQEVLRESLYRQASAVGFGLGTGHFEGPNPPVQPKIIHRVPRSAFQERFQSQSQSQSKGKSAQEIDEFKSHEDHDHIQPEIPMAGDFVPVSDSAPSPQSSTSVVVNPGLSFKEKLKTFFTAINDSSSFMAVAGWSMVTPAIASTASDFYQLKHSSNTYPDIKIEILDDSSMKFIPEAAKSDRASPGSSGRGLIYQPNQAFFQDYFSVIFKSLEASGQKYELEDSLNNLLDALKKQYGLGDKTIIEAGLKDALKKIGTGALLNFMQGDTLAAFQAYDDPSAPSVSVAPEMPFVSQSRSVSTQKAFMSRRSSRALDSNAATVYAPGSLPLSVIREENGNDESMSRSSLPEGPRAS